MLSQLSSGTPVNPTLSVVAPPGLQFFNDVKCVPLVYGNALIEGTIIADMSATSAADFVNSSSGWGTALWQAICFGKINLNAILFDSILAPYFNGNKYDVASFNNGDPVNFQSEYPPIYEKLVNTTSYTLLQWLSALHGIAHYYFTGPNAVPFTDDNNTTVKKVRYDINRILNSGIFNPNNGTAQDNWDDIPWATAEVDEYHTTHFTFVNQNDLKNYIDGDTITLSLPGTGVATAPDGTAIVFLTPSSLTLPSPLVPGQVYYLYKFNNGIIGSNDHQISATLGGGMINYSSNYNPLVVVETGYCSIPQQKNAGNNPGAVIFDIIKNPFYGLGLDTTIDINPITGALLGGTLNRDINVQSFWRVMNFFYNSAAKPYGINCTFQEQTSAKDMIKKICEWTDCILTKDNNGKYYLTVNDPARLNTQGRMGGIALSSLQKTDSSGVPLLSTDDFIDFKPTFKTIDDTINEFRAKFCSFANSYTNLETFFRNEANISETGTTRAKEYDLASFIFPEIVATRIQEIAKRESFPLITIESVCSIGMITALVNDIFHIQHPEYGIDDYFKITKKCIGELENGQVKISWIQCSELMFDLYGGVSINASPSVPSGTPPGQNVPGIIVNLTFSLGSNMSSVRTPAFSDDTKSIVSWGAGQENTGPLVYTADGSFASGGDYTVISHNQIELNPTKWANTIQANVLGLLNVDTQQGQ